MTQYTATKTLVSAVPRVRTEDNVVLSWDLTVNFEHNGWSRDYPHTHDVTSLNKTVNDFTQSELIGYLPPVMDLVFDSHYITFNLPSTEETLADFDVNSISK
jgi:hypothetical protein